MQGKQQRWLALLPLGVLALAMVACGGFQIRGTAPIGTATRPLPTATAASTAIPPTAEPVATAGTAEATAEPTQASPSAGGVLTPGAKARVAVASVNVRSEARAAASKVGALANGAVVTVRGGPSVADNYTWYQIDNGAGLTGWVASGTANEAWLVPDTGAPGSTPAPSGPRLVNRPIKVGDMVQVTTTTNQTLTVRENAGKGATEVARVKAGVRFTVKGGPTQQDNLTWWQLEGEEVKGWAAEGDGTDRWLTPLER